MSAHSAQPGTPPAPTAAGPGWSLVMPVKPLGLAKTRLAAFAGPHRSRLALAFALDTAGAALASPGVARLVAVTGDPEAGALLSALGAVVVTDEPGTGLNAALAHGAARAAALAPHSPVATLSADLPALRPAELARVLAAAARPPGRAFLPDAPGIGTTLLSCPPGDSLRPAFGGRSRERHAAGGARELRLDGVASVRRDVDTGADLREALVLGVGPHTAAVASALV